LVYFFFFFFFSYIVFFDPNLLSHPDNWIQANPIVTPAHIVPEWYFLPFYAILRSIPDKLLGVIALLCSILILFLFPQNGFPLFRSGAFRPQFRIWFSSFVFISFLLAWIGAKPIEFPFLDLGQLFSFMYFLLIEEEYTNILLQEQFLFLFNEKTS